MKVEASSIEELIEKSAPFDDALRQLNQFIQTTAPDLEVELFSAPSMTMIGYGKMPCKNKTGWGGWEYLPLLAAAPQKRNISLYMPTRDDGLPLLETYVDSLGKVSLGKGCVRFTKFENLDLDALSDLLRDAAAWAESSKDSCEE